jgi:RNA polymerase sigma-70 factor (ECF subfamily)
MPAAGAAVYGDSGGVPPAWRQPVFGQVRVSRLMAGSGNQIRGAEATIRPAQVNGQPGAMVLDPDGSLINIFVLDIADDQIQAIRSVINRDKLRHLGPLADLPRLRAALRRGPAGSAGADEAH